MEGRRDGIGAAVPLTVVLSHKIASLPSFLSLPLEMPVDCRLFQLLLNRLLNLTPFGKPSCRGITKLSFPRRPLSLPRNNFILAFVKILSSSMAAERCCSLSLERGSGKKCYMLSARDLFIVWSDTPAYWGWVSIPESRFQEVAQLIHVCWVEIRGKIPISMLSPSTNYKAYLVFKATARSYGFDYQPVEVSVGLVGTEGCKRIANLDATTQPTEASDVQYPKARGDGWLEIELGEFFNDGLYVDRELEMSVLEKTVLWWKGGVLVQGIEIRPNPCL